MTYTVWKHSFGKGFPIPDARNEPRMGAVEAIALPEILIAVFFLKKEDKNPGLSETEDSCCHR